jgi:hypothetical protein
LSTRKAKGRLAPFLDLTTNQKIYHRHENILWDFNSIILASSYLVHRCISLLDTNTINFISISGTLASITGLIFVLIQTSHAIKLSQATKEAAENSRNKIISLFNTIDIAKLQKTIHEVQQYNRSKKFQLSILRMQEVREGLQNIRCNTNLTSILPVQKINKLVSMMSVDISSIEKQLLTEDLTIDISKLNNNLDSILNEINTLNSEIKYNGE